MSFFDRFRGFGWSQLERLIEPAGSTGLGVALPFAYARVPGERAEQAVDIFLRERPNLTPVIIGHEDKTRQLADFFGDSDLNQGPPEDIIDKANAFDVDDWFENRKREYQDHEPEDDAVLPTRSDWPETPETQNGIVSTRDVLTGKFHESVAIALLPTGGAHHEAAAYLHMGGWNEMPDAIVQVALHKRWAKEWGARPVVLAFDTIEFTVGNSPKSRANALRLGNEHFLACNDIIDQGFGSLENLAASLIGARNWYLWWD